MIALLNVAPADHADIWKHRARCGVFALDSGVFVENPRRLSVYIAYPHSPALSS